MSAELDASTVTPGRTAPDVSLTTPTNDEAMFACAEATAGSRITISRMDSARNTRFMVDLANESRGYTKARTGRTRRRGDDCGGR
jgi:hypothetical protein